MHQTEKCNWTGDKGILRYDNEELIIRVIL